MGTRWQLLCPLHQWLPTLSVICWSTHFLHVHAQQCPNQRDKTECGCKTFNFMHWNFMPGRSQGSSSVEKMNDDDHYAYIGDMAFRKDQLARDQAKDLDLKYWPGGIIFYVIDDAFSVDYIDKIVTAMSEIQLGVGSHHLEFRGARTSDGKICRSSYLFVAKTDKEQCMAEVGMQIGLTHLWLNEKSCLPGTIQHELLHALGRYHEQCRPDRDDYVTLIPPEMNAAECSNYARLPNSSSDPTLKLPYDVYSIMHYGSCYFTCRGNYTMLKKDGWPIIPNRQRMTQWDIEKVRVMFPADAKVVYDDKFCPDSGASGTPRHGGGGIVPIMMTAILVSAVRIMLY